MNLNTELSALRVLLAQLQIKNSDISSEMGIPASTFSSALKNGDREFTRDNWTAIHKYILQRISFNELLLKSINQYDSTVKNLNLLRTNLKIKEPIQPLVLGDQNFIRMDDEASIDNNVNNANVSILFLGGGSKSGKSSQLLNFKKKYQQENTPVIYIDLSKVLFESQDENEMLIYKYIYLPICELSNDTVKFKNLMFNSEEFHDKPRGWTSKNIVRLVKSLKDRYEHLYILVDSVEHITNECQEAVLDNFIVSMHSVSQHEDIKKFATWIITKKIKTVNSGTLAEKSSLLMTQAPNLNLGYMNYNHVSQLSYQYGIEVNYEICQGISSYFDGNPFLINNLLFEIFSKNKKIDEFKKILPVKITKSYLKSFFSLATYVLNKKDNIIIDILLDPNREKLYQNDLKHLDMACLIRRQDKLSPFLKENFNHYK